MKKLIPAIVCIVLIGSVAMAAAPQQQNKTAAKEQKAAVKRDLKDDKRDLKQDQAEMTRLSEEIRGEVDRLLRHFARAAAGLRFPRNPQARITR